MRLCKSRQAVIGITMIAVVVLLAVFAPLLAPNDPNRVNISKRFAEPGGEFPLGADHLGRCELSRLIFGARTSLGIASAILVLIAAVSIVLGMLFSYYGGIADRIFSGICDVLMAFPPMVFILAFAGAMGPGVRNIIISVVLANWVWYARVVRSYVMLEKNKEYILSARAAGSSDFRIMARHIMPNIMPPLLVFFSLGIGDSVLMISGFSFLGIGVDPSVAEWGTMISNARSVIYTQPQLMFYPGLCIFFTICGFNIFGEALRDVLSLEELGGEFEYGKTRFKCQRLINWIKRRKTAC